jgi:hypothetical protein
LNGEGWDKKENVVHIFERGTAFGVSRAKRRRPVAIGMKVKVKQSHYRPQVAQRVQGS